MHVLKDGLEISNKEGFEMENRVFEPIHSDERADPEDKVRFTKTGSYDH